MVLYNFPLRKGGTMANFLQVPGELNITATSGDDFEFYLDFDIALTGYTFSAEVILIATLTIII